jgi:mannose-6-phosphate isomerase-like protein (cupin superfamily)
MSTDFTKGPTLALGPDDGESFWQPLPSLGYITTKITPYNSPYDEFSLGIQVLEPGAHIRRHAHERSHEILFCYRGHGRAEIEDREIPLAEESVLLIGRGIQHKVINTGSSQMKLVWIISPAGLEDWFRAIGRARRPGDAMPKPFDRPADVERIQDQQRFIRPDRD